jgi:hypothetical protein
MSQEPDEPFPGKPLGNGLYEVDEEVLKDALIFRPGIPDYDSKDFETVPTEPVTAETVLQPVDVVIFYDRWSRHPLSGGCNQWAFVVDGERALFSRWLVHSMSLKRLRQNSSAIAIRRIPPELAEHVAAFLLRYRWRPALFKAAVNFLQFTNYMPFLTGKFFPDDVTYKDDAETFDRTSFISKMIALLTHGPFSHVATYLGDGKIFEIVTSGARVVPIETYKGRHKYRVAAYRHYGHNAMTQQEYHEMMMSDVGSVRYGYLGAIGAGIRSYFGFHRESGSPNGIVLSGPLAFIEQA